MENSIPLSIFPIKADQVVFCLCGLPGRGRLKCDSSLHPSIGHKQFIHLICIHAGKTRIARRIAKYLSFFHAMPVQLFNSTEYRRKMCGSVTDEQWFDATNEEARKLRQACNEAVIVDILAFLNQHVNGVAILDSTNPDHNRRLNLLTKVSHSIANVYKIMQRKSIFNVYLYHRLKLPRVLR